MDFPFLGLQNELAEKGKGILVAGSIGEKESVRVNPTWDANSFIAQTEPENSKLQVPGRNSDENAESITFIEYCGPLLIGRSLRDHMVGF